MKNKRLKQYSIITVGVILCAIGLEYFFYPNDIAAGGISGLALVINRVTGISNGITMIGFNIVLFALAFWLIGGSFGGNSIYAAFGLSAVLWFMEKFIPVFAVTENLFLATIFGSVLCAIGLVLVFEQNASTGGTSIIAKMLNKYFHIDIGKSLFYADFFVTILAIYIFGVEKGLYGIIGVYLVGILIDKFIEGFNMCKQVFIISNKSEEIGNFIVNEISRGCTKIQGTGVYSKQKNNILYVVIHRKEFILLKNKIKEIDPQAFITVSDCREVLGEGFADLLEK